MALNELSPSNSSIQLRYVALTLLAASSSSSTHGPRPSNKHAGWTKKMDGRLIIA